MCRFQSVMKLLCSRELGLQAGMLVRPKSVLDVLLGTETLGAPEEGAVKMLFSIVSGCVPECVWRSPYPRRNSEVSVSTLMSHWKSGRNQTQTSAAVATLRFVLHCFLVLEKMIQEDQGCD